MVLLTTRFVHLVLVLVALGAFDGAPWLSKAGVSAAPTGATAARIGIVLKEDTKLDSVSSTAATSLAPSRRGSSFEDYDLAKGNKDAISVPLEHVNAHDRFVHPLMLFQQHINRANVKLARMGRREPPSPEELSHALIDRRRSIEEAYGGLEEEMLEARSAKKPFKASNVKLPSSHGRIGVVITRDVVDEKPTMEKRLWPGVFGALSSSSSTDDGLSSVTSDSIQAAKSTANKYAYSDTLLPAAPVTAANSLGLSIESNNIGYVATIQVGAKKTPFKMLIDSGSADMWVPSSKCKNCGTSQQKLSTNISSSLKTSKESWDITYGTGNAKGVLATDDITIAGLTLKNYKFALATSESDDFSSSPFDGLMGLAQQSLSNARSPTPIDALFNDKLVSAPVMGYKLGDATANESQSGSETNTEERKRATPTQQDGQVTFGGVDSSKYTGKLVEIPNVSTQGFYEIPIQGVSVNGKTIDKLSTGRTSILDTGTSLMVAPQSDAEAVHEQIPGAKSDGQGGFTVPCNTTSTLSFKFGGQDWPLLARDLIFVPLNENQPDGDCISSLGGGSVGQANEWLVGAAALKRLYFATNANKNVIGLGKLANPVK